jgi:hypothetical protein
MPKYLLLKHYRGGTTSQSSQSERPASGGTSFP